MTDNVMMVSADRSVVAGEQGPFHVMLEAFHRHWDRVDVIGTPPERVEATRVFGNVHLHHPPQGTSKLRQARFIAETGKRLAAERDYTVITSHDYNPFYNGVGSWRISKATGIPYVAEIHHVPGHPRAASLRERLDVHATKQYVRWAMHKAAGIRVVNGGELPALLTRWGVPRERIHVLHSLYLDLETFRPADTTPASFDCDLLFVGRLVPNKGLPAIVDGLRRLVAEGQGDLRLKLLGRGPELQRVRDLARRWKLERHVDHVEWVPDSAALAEVYRRARFLVCASTSEGGPRVVPEAMACGTPAVSTEVGLVGELIQDGRNGLLFDGSGRHLAEVVGPLLTDAEAERRLRDALPAPALADYAREDVIARLADGLKAIAAAAVATR